MIFKLKIFGVDWSRLVVGIVLLFLMIRTTHCDSYYSGNVTKSNRIDRRKSEDSNGQSEEDVRTSGCAPSCMREQIRNRNIQVIKDEVLKKMGFDKPPNLTGKTLPQVPEHILAMVEDTAGWQADQPQYHSVMEEEDEYHAKMEKVITFAQPFARLRHWKGHEILHFSFSERITKYHVANATLYVYIKGTEKRPLPIFTLEIFKVYKSDAPGTVKVTTRKITQPFGQGEWLKIDISALVSEWFKNPKENLGFIINGTVEGKKVVLPEKSNDGKKLPYVEISTRDSKRRIRRNSLNCDENSNENICCRYPLTVDFVEFGWDFIIAPKRYEAYYCAGECSYLSMQKFPHTHLATMAAPNTATPCCAPRKLSAISMLYFDTQMNVVFGSLPGMVVDRCGCS